MRVADLRAELHAAGIDHSGLKAALVQRVEALRMLSPRTAAAAPTRATRGTKRVRLELQPAAEDTGEGETVDLAGGQTAARAEGTSDRVAAPAEPPTGAKLSGRKRGRPQDFGAGSSQENPRSQDSQLPSCPMVLQSCRP